VGARTCSPECICAPTGTLPTKATDALLCLSVATGQPLALNCPCNEPPGDGPIGYVSATRSTAIIPGFLPGLPATISDDFSLGGIFNKITSNVAPPDVTQTVENIGGCTVTTTDSTQVINDNDPLPTVVNYDPGEPGDADNGTVSVDLERQSSGGFESFAPQGDPLALGFDGDQDVAFSWPGGDDINAFAASIGVPPNVEVTSPDLESSTFDVTPGDPVAVEWVPGSDDDGKLSVSVSSSIIEFTQGQGGSSTIHSESVVIVCLFTDSAGSGTVPAAATEKLQDPVSLPLLYSKSFTALRANGKDVGVTAPTAGGSRSVTFSGTSSVTRLLTSGFPF